MTAIPISRQLMPPKQRLKELNEQLAQLRLQAKVAAGVTVLRIRSCEHEECGGRAPAELPDNCLVIVGLPASIHRWRLQWPLRAALAWSAHHWMTH